MRKVLEDFIGTCQCCFGEFKVGNDKRMVIHGYRRPGIGYAVGECRGTNHTPFEYDHSLTDQIIVEYHADIANLNKYLSQLTGGEISQLTHYWTEYKKDEKGHTVYKNGYAVELKLSEQVSPGHKNWEKTLRLEVANVENEANYLSRVVAYLEMRVATWQRLPIVGFDTPATGLERYLRLAYDPVREDEEKRLQAKRDELAARKGKLRLVMYWVVDVSVNRHENWNVSDNTKKAVKAWAKGLFTEGNLRVSEGTDYDILRRDRLDWKTHRQHVMVLNIDWSYVDTLPEMIEGLVRVNETNKKVHYFLNLGNEIEGTSVKPWDK